RAGGAEVPVHLLLVHRRGRRLVHEPAVVEVVGEPAVQVGAGERLDEVVQHPAGHRGAHRLHLPGRGDDDDVDHRPVLLAQPVEDLEPGEVGQADVEQEEVQTQPAHRGERVGSGVDDVDDRELGQLLDEAAVQGGDGEVVVDDDHPNGHRAASSARDVAAIRGGGRVTRRGPPPGASSTQMVPPRRVTTWRTRVSPMPRVRRPLLVETPGSKIRSRSAAGTPGPSSLTRTTAVAPCRARLTRTVPPAPAASTALSSRLPRTVTTSVVPSGWTSASGSVTSSTPRSCAVAVFATMSAATAGSVTPGSAS